MIACIEGNIGCGKSTLLESLREDGWDVVPEPVDEWGEMLVKYYEDPGTWALPFNLRVLHDFHEAKRPGVFERSPGACRYVFGTIAYNDGHLTPMEWETFKGYHELLGWKPDVYVYLDVPPEECHRRLLARGRPGEIDGGVTPEYLDRIHFQYQTFFRFCDVPVVKIDGTSETLVEDVKTHLKTHFNKFM